MNYYAEKYAAMTKEQRQAEDKALKEEIARQKQEFEEKKKAELEERQALLKKYEEERKAKEWPEFRRELFWGICKWGFWFPIIWYICQHYSCTWIKYTP